MLAGEEGRTLGLQKLPEAVSESFVLIVLIENVRCKFAMAFNYLSGKLDFCQMSSSI